MRTAADDIARGASVSSCERYRYALWRDWSDLFGGGRVCWIMLNPSTADGEVDDPTIRRCMGFSKAWGYGGIIVLNLFAFRSTDPAGLIYTDDPIGPGNDAAIREALDSTLTDIVVCAWGANAPRERADAVLEIVREMDMEPHALRLTKSGEPAHPLYLPGSLLPWPFERTEAL